MPIDYIDWNDVPDSAVVPYDAYHCTVRAARFDYSRNGKYMAIVELQVDAPPIYKGAVITNNFVIGSDDDPQADLPDTWKRRAATDLKKMLVGVFGDVAQLTGNPVNDLAGVVGYPVGAIIDEETDNNQQQADGTPNPYYGTTRNRFKGWFNVQAAGAPAPGSLAGTKAAPAAAGQRPGRPPARPPQRPPVAPPAMRATVPMPPSLDDGASPAAPPARAVPQRPAPPRPAAPPARPAPPPPPRA